MAGLPQEGETPVGFSFFKTKSKSFVPTFTFWGQKISTPFVFWKVFLSIYNHHVNRRLELETCCEKNKCKNLL